MPATTPTTPVVSRPGVVGTPVARKEGREKVSGQAQYIDDIVMSDMLHGVTVRSPVPRGILRGIFFDGGIPWDEFVVATAEDVPGRNVVMLLEDDQPLLAHQQICHAAEPIVLLAHPDRQMAEEARRNVRLEIDPLPPLLSLEASYDCRQVIRPPDNLLKKIDIVKGDVDSVWDHAELIVEGEYWTGAQEQLYIEPQGMIAQASLEGVTVWGSMQCPYYVHGALVKMFGMVEDKVRVVQTETGGGFGGKEEYPSMIAGHAALLSWKAGGRAVKMIYDREEDMAATTKRHPSRTRHRTAVLRDGKLLAMDIEFILDGGAYVTLSPVVLSRGAIHAAGCYHCPHVRIRARAVATNMPPYGAFRGFGAPQSLFAMERHMEKIAAAVGVSSEEIRRRNFLHDGLSTATGQVVREGVDLPRILDRALRESDFHARREKFRRDNVNARVKRGIGLATFQHGSGFTGAGEKMLASVAGVEATAEGRVRVLSASTEIGQGTNTIFAQIVADALELPYEQVDVVQPDTAQVPNSGPTVASRTCMIVGKLLETAAVSLRQSLIQARLVSPGYSVEQFIAGCRAWHQHYGHHGHHGQLRSYAQYRLPASINWDDSHYKGDAYGAFAWAAYVAEVSVDTSTWEARVEDFVAVQDIGRVVHPVLAAGQVEGGVAQGIGWALYEDVVWRDGQMDNAQMTNYIMPTSVDAPPIRVFFEEVPHALGPQGAKGVGELPIDGPAPAILNALEDALGVPFDRLPATPEVIMRTMEGIDAV